MDHIGLDLDSSFAEVDNSKDRKNIFPFIPSIHASESIHDTY